MSRVRNIFERIPGELPEELTQDLLVRDGVRIERIVSRGHCSPPGHWYDQDEHEWVILLSGRARLRFEGKPESVELAPGDYVEIPAHVRHRVEETGAAEQRSAGRESSAGRETSADKATDAGKETSAGKETGTGGETVWLAVFYR